MTDQSPAAASPPFYPPDAPVPEQLETPEFRLRMLRATDVDLDYAAVTASREQLLVRSSGRWPRPGFTLEENLADLTEHEQDHRARINFTYTVMNLPETECLGCVYIRPLAETVQAPGATIEGEPVGPYQAAVSFWAATPHLATGLDARLLAAMRSWFPSTWAFTWTGFLANQHQTRHLQIYQAAGMTVRYAISIPQEPHRFYLYS